jgi:Tfp pilus assembly protein PilP
MADVTPTSNTTRKAATRQGALPTHGLILLGTFTGADRPRALIRHGGRVERVQLGDSVGWRRVVAIEDGTLVLMRNGETLRLKVPG